MTLTEVICICFLMVVIPILFIGGIYLAINGSSDLVTSTEGDWNESTAGIISSIDLLSTHKGNYGMAFNIDEKRVNIWLDQFEGDLPKLHQIGMFYSKNVGNKKIYKWVKGYNKEVIKKAVIKNIVVDLPSSNNILEAQVPAIWQSVILKIPLANKTVLVKYKNREVPAYLNDKNKWKLEANRKKSLGGETIKDIKEWKEILR